MYVCVCMYVYLLATSYTPIFCHFLHVGVFSVISVISFTHILSCKLTCGSVALWTVCRLVTPTLSLTIDHVGLVELFSPLPCVYTATQNVW